MFQSRYQAASHFRSVKVTGSSEFANSFQSRYRAASHFRFQRVSRFGCGISACFNLVIERLLISGTFASRPQTTVTFVSISLSSGFSFQVNQFRRDTLA